MYTIWINIKCVAWKEKSAFKKYHLQNTISLSTRVKFKYPRISKIFQVQGGKEIQGEGREGDTGGKGGKDEGRDFVGVPSNFFIRLGDILLWFFNLECSSV